MLESLVAGWQPLRQPGFFAFPSDPSGSRRSTTFAASGNGLAIGSSSTQSSSTSSAEPSGLSTTTAEPLVRRKRHRADHIDAAYELQRNAAIKGAAIYTVIGLGATFFGHHLFPKFRSQTLALKAFITSGFAIFGFVVGADTVLLNHEDRQRTEEDLIRGVARRELAKRGIMASETEIEKWKNETRARLMREREAQDNAEA